MKLQRLFVLSLALLTIVVLTACAATPAPSELPSSTPTPAISSTPIEVTSTSTNIPPELPTATSTPVPAPIPVVFVNAENNVFVWTDGDSSFNQITTSGDVETALISPDGTLIAYTRTTDGESYTLDIINSDGSNHRTLFTHDDFLGIPRPDGASDSRPLEVVWVPNSHMLAMTVNAVLVGPGMAISPDLILFNADESTYHTLLSETEPWEFTFSPDGSKIAAALPDGIDLFDSNGNQLLGTKFYSFSSVNNASEAAFLPSIVWSSDGISFAFTIPPKEPFSDSVGMTRVEKINAIDGSATTLLTAPMAFLMPQEISPDLSHIAYLQSVTAKENKYDLHIASLTGGLDKIYASNAAASDFTWSPDSAHFVYSLASGSSRKAYLGEIDASSALVSEVTDARGYIWLDANRYLVLDKTDSGWKIWLGQIGSTPSELYSDSSTTGTGLPLSVNR